MKYLLIFIFIFSIPVKAEEFFINDLNCENYSKSKITCINIKKVINNQQGKLNSYEIATIDNQLKKITFLLNKNKNDIAFKKYNYLFKSLKDIIPKEDFEIINKSKVGLFEILNSYSKSSDYTPNPKYKLNI